MLLPELCRQWQAEALLVPSHYENMGVYCRTQWTALGEELRHSSEYKQGMLAAKPGVHYVAVAPQSAECHLFPEHPGDIYSVFRHAWVLARRLRPHVIVIEGLKRPHTFRSTTEHAKYSNLFSAHGLCSAEMWWYPTSLCWA